MTENENHLSNDQIEWFLEPQGLSQTIDSRGELFDQASHHLAICEKCQRLVAMHAEWHRILNGLRRDGAAEPTSKCPDNAALVNLAGGIQPQEETEHLLTHVSSCSHCGPLLRELLYTFRDESNPEEQIFLATLQSSKPEWQSRMAGILREATPPQLVAGKSRSFWALTISWPRLGFAAVAIVLFTLVVFVGTRLLRPPSAEQLLAQAYTERRTMEIRIPGAQYAPLHVERSMDGSSFARPASLLKAEALISENLGRNSADPGWLQVKARAELLDGANDEAVKSLELALESKPDSSSLLADLGSAYYLRARATNQPIDYGRAVEFLGRALAKQPDDPVTLFNHALACEQMHLYSQAVEDWEHYLRVDTQGGWAEEARKRLSVLREKLQEHEHSMAEPLLAPSAIAKAGPFGNEIRPSVDDRIEAYLHIAVAEWLPKAFPDSISDVPSNDARFALATLASILRDEHSDLWLTDLLNQSLDPKFPQAVRALSASVTADDRGDYSAAHGLARLATMLFREAHSPAGELRAQAEEIYSDQLLYEGKECESLLSQIKVPLQRTSYAWLQAQSSLERSNCADLVGDLGTYGSEIDAGMAQAFEHKYLSLYLRGLGFKAQATASSGDAKTGFALASDGLNAFWSHSVDLIKGYNLYTDLDTAADEIHLPVLQTTIWKEATALIDHHPDILQRAMAHRWYANAAYLANMPALAIAEFSKASTLLSEAPQSPATTRDYLDAEIWLALLEIRQGDLDHADARLHRIEPLLTAAPSFEPEIRFADARAEIGMKRADSATTEAALKTAVYLAEWALKSLPSENDRAQWARETQNTYRDFVEWKLRQGDAIGALELWQWYRGAELRAERQPPSEPQAPRWDTVPDFHDIPPLPQPTMVEDQLSTLRHETVVTYATFSDGIAAWTYDDRGIFWNWIPTRSPEISDLALRFKRLCADPHSDITALRSSGHTLYGLLIEPFQYRLAENRTLLLDPDDALKSIPWEALVDSQSRYLIERSPIVVIPGVYRISTLRRPALIGRDSRVLIVSVASTPGMNPLTDADGEGQYIAAKFPSSRWLHDEGANLAAIRREIDGSVVFHFAGHAVLSPSNSGLALGERDPATQQARLLGGTSLLPSSLGHLQLAVLSACDTANEQQGGASGTEGLVQLLLNSGTPNVVASRWSVDSTQTALLMERFYENVLAGNSIPNSLRSSEIAVASQARSAHPYYWSAFQLEGTQ